MKQQNEGVSEDDVNEIKQVCVFKRAFLENNWSTRYNFPNSYHFFFKDISAFRYELLGILRNAGFNTGHTDINQKTYSRNKKRSAMAERRLKKGLPEFNIPVPESFQQHSISKMSSQDSAVSYAFKLVELSEDSENHLPSEYLS